MYLLKRLYIIQIVLQKHASTFFLLMLMLRAIRAGENAGKSGMKFSYSITFSYPLIKCLVSPVRHVFAFFKLHSLLWILHLLTQSMDDPMY